MESWKTIANYPDYEISNLGRVKSLKFKREKILKQTVDNTGYPTVCLYISGFSKKIDVHKLVAIAFLNHVPDGYKLVVNHKDFNKENNNVKNLEIVTNRENSNLKHKKHSSKYTGVSWHKNQKKWASTIYINGKLKYLGSFNNEIEASNKYQETLSKLNNHE